MSQSTQCSYILIGNRVRVKSLGLALGFFRNLAASVGSKQLLFARQLIPRKCSLCSQGSSKQASALIHREENRVEFLARQFLSEKLSFVHKKESEHSFGLSLSTCVFYRRIFNLEMQNFSFVDGWRLLRCQIRRLLPTPDVVAHLTFAEGGGYSWFSLGKNFFPNPLELEIFSWI